MAIKTYQVTLDEDGQALSAIRLPDEPAKTRTIIVREETLNKAKKAAEDLFTFAK